MKALLITLLCLVSWAVTQPQPEPSSSGPEPYVPPYAPGPHPNGSVPSPQPLPDPNQNIYNWIEIVLKALCIVVGLQWLIFGFRFMFRPRITLFLAGFIIFYFITFQLLVRYTVQKDFIKKWLAYTLAVVAGIVGSALFILSVPVGRFFFSALTGVLFTTLLFTYTPLGTVDLAPVYQLAIIGGVGVLLGFISLVLNKLIPIVGTSFNGAFLVANAVDNFFNFSPAAGLLVKIMQSPDWATPNTPIELSNWHIYVVLGGILIATVIGILVQYLATASTFSFDRDNDVENSENMALLEHQRKRPDY
jgi:hypothetical protein